MRKKTAIGIFLFIGKLYAASSSQYTIDAVANAYGATVSSHDKNSTRDGKGVGSIKDMYSDTVIYNDLFYKKSHEGNYIEDPTGSRATREGIHIARPADIYFKKLSEDIKRQKAEDAERKKAEEAARKPDPKQFFVGGYCIAMNKTEIIKSSGFAQFDCDLNFGKYGYRNAQVFAGVYPDYKREILIGIPVYASFNSGARAAFKGVILNSRKTSLNIANIVETYKIRQYIVKYGLAISDVAYQYSTAYLTQLELSKVSQQITYIPTTTPTGGVTTTPVQTTNIAAPDPSTYFALAGIGLLDRMLAIGADNILEDTTPLFTISKGNRVWIEGVVDFDENAALKIFGALSDGIKSDVENSNSNYLQQNKATTTDTFKNRLIMPTTPTLPTTTSTTTTNTVVQ